MTLDLRDQLQATLGSAYTLERELGGGGMSRVFVAMETALRRRVAVKVLSPELSAGLNVDRFRREIQLAAQLQHPHIVPVLVTGEMNGLPYYTMPFVEGESLRGRLQAMGPLPVAEVLSYLRDVARALGYAHQRSIVHRDIKPDNVLLSGGSAVVTDFGVAKALSDARTGETNVTLTRVGTSLGTPAYMAPEQVAADVSTDHRADFYAFGAMAYELLAGQAPFAGRTPQKMLAAQMSERPEPIEDLRPDTPPALARLVMRCLEKEPADRPQSADEVLRELDAAASSGGQSAGPVLAIATRRSLGRALAIYAGSFLGVALLARAATIVIGLPDWVVPGALFVMGLGLPVLLFTALVQHQARAALTRPTLTPGGTATQHSTVARLALKARPHLTWRRAAWGGAVAVGVFAVIVGGYMALRLLGIGPAGSLRAAGVFGKQERLVVTDFTSPAADTTLGPAVTEALRTDLAQSPNLVVLDARSVSAALDRMQRPAGTRLDLALARELATREGVKAVVDGGLLAIGGSYVVTAQLVATGTGEVLASYRETADDARGILPAIGRLSHDLRAKAGESLKSVHETAPLVQVTTASLPALRKYAQALQVASVEGEGPKPQALLEEAIALDSGFAMAWRKLGVLIGNTSGPEARRVQAMQAAFDHGNRLPPVERNLAAAAYYEWVKGDEDKAAEAYEAVLELQPDNYIALNNVGSIYDGRRQFDKAIAAYQKTIDVHAPGVSPYVNLARLQLARGDTVAPGRILNEGEAAMPANVGIDVTRIDIMIGLRRYDSAEVAIRSTLRKSGNTALGRSTAGYYRSAIALIEGRVALAERTAAEGVPASVEIGRVEDQLLAATIPVLADVYFRHQARRGLERLDRVLVEHPLSAIPALQRPYNALALLYAAGGQPARARRLLAERDREVPAGALRATRHFGNSVRGQIELAEGNAAAAIATLRVADSSACLICIAPVLARAFDAAGQRDSAIAEYARFIEHPDSRRIDLDPTLLAPSLVRLGELYEARGDKARAIATYQQFLVLWKDADPDLQPTVADVRNRVEVLSGKERGGAPVR